MLSAYHLPLVTNHLSVFRSPSHDPILLIPVGKTIRLFNLTTFGPRTPPQFPLDDLELMTARLGISENEGAKDLERDRAPPRRDPEENEDEEEEKEEEKEEDEVDGRRKDRGVVPSTTYPPPAPLAMLFESVEGWEVVVGGPATGGTMSEFPEVGACAMGFDGLAVVGLGEKGTLYIWRLKE